MIIYKLIDDTQTDMGLLYYIVIYKIQLKYSVYYTLFASCIYEVCLLNHLKEQRCKDLCAFRT